MGYQIKTLGYTDKTMRRDMRRALRGMALGRPWLRLGVAIGRVLTVGLCAACLFLAAVVTLAMVISPGEMEDGGWAAGLLWGGFLLFLLLSLTLRPMPDPIRDNLWPPEADVVTVTFLDKLVQVEDGRSVIQLDYQMIRDIRETEECFYLFPMKSHFLMLRKRDFVEGDPDRFRSFLAGRMGNRLLV